MRWAGIALACAAVVSDGCASRASGTASGAGSGAASQAARAAALRPSIQRVRAIEFDNTYGVSGSLPVHVKVDSGAEYPLTATCDAKTCSVRLVLLNGPHEVTIAVEQKGLRSEPTVLSLDTTAVP